MKIKSPKRKIQRANGRPASTSKELASVITQGSLFEAEHADAQSCARRPDQFETPLEDQMTISAALNKEAIKLLRHRPRAVRIDLDILQQNAKSLTGNILRVQPLFVLNRKNESSRT